MGNEMPVVHSASAAGAFEVGDAVRVKRDFPDHHHRTPHFVKGKPGVARAVSGPFHNPETRAHGGDGLPKRLLYQVEFDQADIWGRRCAEGAADTLLVDIYEHWLEARDTP